MNADKGVLNKETDRSTEAQMKVVLPDNSGKDFGIIAHIKGVIIIMRKHGIIYTIRKTIGTITHSKIKGYSVIRSALAGKEGLEIGGPSQTFSAAGRIPLYPIVSSLDGCNFSSTTIWEGKIELGLTYKYAPDKAGTQFICEGSNLVNIASERYDFLLSCHSLEHMANPLLTLNEWKRVLKPGGYLLLVLPLKNYTFDHRRQDTSFEHIKQDFENRTGEDDLSHLDEVVRLHDYEMLKQERDVFLKRSMDNFNNRALHHHVLSRSTVRKIMEFCDLQVVFEMEDDEIVIMARKFLEAVRSS